MIEINDRVGVILKTDNKTKECFFLGYGIYEGKFIPDIINCSKKKLKHVKGLIKTNLEVCRFKLDNKEIYYDFDIWFMSAKRFEDVFIHDEYEEGWKIVNVDRKGKWRKNEIVLSKAI
jgi:hypothetical protein